MFVFSFLRINESNEFSFTLLIDLSSRELSDLIRVICPNFSKHLSYHMRKQRTVVILKSQDNLEMWSVLGPLTLEWIVQRKLWIFKRIVPCVLVWFTKVRCGKVWAQRKWTRKKTWMPEHCRVNSRSRREGKTGDTAGFVTANWKMK